jgi:hypothetical protein
MTGGRRLSGAAAVGARLAPPAPPQGLSLNSSAKNIFSSLRIKPSHMGKHPKKGSLKLYHFTKIERFYEFTKYLLHFRKKGCTIYLKKD